MGKTITGTVNVGITLSATADNPVLVAAGAVVSGDDAIYAGGTVGWTITNRGALGGTTGDGVYIQHGGRVTNAASAAITGLAYGVNVGLGAATVVNSGGISETGFYGTGVRLGAGGAVTNAASGSITSYDGPGISISGGIGTVVNAGSIAGSTLWRTIAPGLWYSTGIVLAAGGTVTNAASASITGYRNGVSITGGAGTVINAGRIYAGVDSGVYLQQGTVINGSSTNTSAAISSFHDGVLGGKGAVTVDNYATICGGTHFGPLYFGVDLQGGGQVINRSSGYIQGLMSAVRIYNLDHS